MLFQGSDVATTQQVQELRKKAPKSTAEKDDNNEIVLFGSDEYEEIDGWTELCGEPRNLCQNHAAASAYLVICVIEDDTVWISKVIDKLSVTGYHLTMHIVACDEIKETSWESTGLRPRVAACTQTDGPNHPTGPSRLI
ncbi:hypothetical protein BIW11_04643 [Tropilaelaps mercedesae]|uniref:Uncharacterized protein n=1 Tax=Tropilaelaps mercedesae TaxID=418985 RepID=A0A1V9X328_9ACAR|nr:hypothetical protein BIW11_04643 [Tropilaelaps mercedesae]